MTQLAGSGPWSHQMTVTVVESLVGCREIRVPYHLPRGMDYRSIFQTDLAVPEKPTQSDGNSFVGSSGTKARQVRCHLPYFPLAVQSRQKISSTGSIVGSESKAGHRLGGSSLISLTPKSGAPDPTGVFCGWIEGESRPSPRSSEVALPLGVSG